MGERSRRQISLPCGEVNCVMVKPVKKEVSWSNWWSKGLKEHLGIEEIQFWSLRVLLSIVGRHLKANWNWFELTSSKECGCKQQTLWYPASTGLSKRYVWFVGGHTVPVNYASKTSVPTAVPAATVTKLGKYKQVKGISDLAPLNMLSLPNPASHAYKYIHVYTYVHIRINIFMLPKLPPCVALLSLMLHAHSFITVFSFTMGNPACKERHLTEKG